MGKSNNDKAQGKTDKTGNLLLQFILCLPL